MDREEEQDAIEACRRGEAGAYRVLVEAYYPRAVRLAWSVVGDSGDAQDLAQEAFVAAYRSMPRFIPGRPFFPWLRGILMNRCRMFLRTRRRAAARRDTAAEQPDHWAVARAGDGGADSRRRADLVRRGLRTLDDDDRSLLVLKHVEGYTYDELAETLGVPAGTVMSRLYRARRRLRDALVELDPSLLDGERGHREEEG